ncbi:glycoside hydrolase family 28 protein [Paenibacillus cisolokensis]|uniref:glycoside hydrolase family 28 protein n=1 Tax=Paenibacillus cisolokensis TaxID=1658519 RepID=UPI003D28079A
MNSIHKAASEPRITLPELPTFPDRTFDIEDFGAAGDGVTDNTAAISGAIDACASAGGGTVRIPDGLWLTGPIRLRSGVNLHAERGALVLFSRRFDDYPLVPTSYEGLRTYRCVSPLYGRDLHDIAITGEGIFDGGGDTWRPVKRMKMTENQWKALVDSGGVTDPGERMWWPTERAMRGASIVKRLLAEGSRQMEAYLEARDFLRPTLLQLDRCRRVLLDGSTFRNSPSWCLHPWLCEHVTIRNVTVKNPWHSQNGDGLDIDSCRYVEVADSHFDVGDDAICVKSGKDRDGRELGAPCEHIAIRGCVVYHGHGGFVVGSEMSGGVRDVAVDNCTFIGTDTGLRFKSARGRGGVVERIRVRNIRMTAIAKEAITFSLYYGHGGPDQPETAPISEETPVFRDIAFEHIRCVGAHQAIYMKGLPEMPFSNIRFRHVHMTAKKGISLERVQDAELSDIRIVCREDPPFALRDCGDIRIERADGGSARPYAKVDGAAARRIVIRFPSDPGEGAVECGPEADPAQIRIVRDGGERIGAD